MMRESPEATILAGLSPTGNGEAATGESEPWPPILKPSNEVDFRSATNRNSATGLASGTEAAMVAAGVGVGVIVGVGVGVGVGVKPGVGVAVGDTVGVGVPWLSTMRRGEITQPARLNSSTATGKHPATVLSRVALSLS